MNIDRRDFIRAASLTVVTVSCSGMLASLISSCTNVKYVQSANEGSRLKIALAELANQSFVVVKSERLPAPVYLAKNEDKQYNAVLMQCTHKQCELTPTGNFMTCPCHGSEFSASGAVLKSPAVNALKNYPLSFDEQFVYIQIR